VTPLGDVRLWFNIVVLHCTFGAKTAAFGPARPSLA